MVNSKSISGDVITANGENHLTNSGSIAGSVFGGANADIFTNSKTISGDVHLGDGTNTLTNTGTIAGQFLGGTGVDTVTNTGHIVGKVDLGAGNDTYTGGKLSDTVYDNDGADTYKLETAPTPMLRSAIPAATATAPSTGVRVSTLITPLTQRRRSSSISTRATISSSARTRPAATMSPRPAYSTRLPISRMSQAAAATTSSMAPPRLTLLKAVPATTPLSALPATTCTAAPGKTPCSAAPVGTC